jgi:hypothetical protein
MSHQKSGKTDKNTSSGHGALGMGGQPTDDPRDLNSGGGDRVEKDDRTAKVPGAFGSGQSRKEEGTPGL